MSYTVKHQDRHKLTALFHIESAKGKPLCNPKANPDIYQSFDKLPESADLCQRCEMRHAELTNPLRKPRPPRKTRAQQWEEKHGNKPRMITARAPREKRPNRGGTK